MKQPEIWVLGSNHSKAQKSILWDSTFPNFTNSDILIINLEKLDSKKRLELHSKLTGEARRYVFDSIMAGNTVIVILSDNIFASQWLPIFPELQKIARSRVNANLKNPEFNNYFKNVEDCSYYIKSFDWRYALSKTDPANNNSERYAFSKSAEQYYFGKLTIDQQIENRGKQIIGVFGRFNVTYGIPSLDHTAPQGFVRNAFNSGLIVFLPPPTKITAEQAIDDLISIMSGGRISETPPSWAQEIDLPGISDLSMKLSKKGVEIESLIEERRKVERELTDLSNLRGLVWMDGPSLEDIVMNAFKILGFEEIRKIRAQNLEDWVVDFQHVIDYMYAVFEIKGAEKYTSLADLTQCNKWVEDYLLEEKIVKGIFVPNQNRRIDARKNSEEREIFAPNQINYAQTREICILPTTEILKAVQAKLNGATQITRKYIENKLATCNGLCRLT